MSNRGVTVFLLLMATAAVVQGYAAALSITSPATLPGGIVGVPYNQTMGATGGAPPYTWSVPSGSLPSGVVLFTGGSFNGAPSAAGVFNFTATVTDSASATASAQFSITVISWVSCTYSISPASASFTSQGGTASIAVTTQSGCPWAASSSLAWVTIPSGASGSGSGTATIQVAANASSATLSGTITVAGQSFSITQAGAQTSCTYSIYPVGQAFTVPGGTGTIAITAGSGCSWSTSGLPSWVSIGSGASGSGNGTVSYSTAANTGAWRSATFTVAGSTFTVEQASATVSGMAFVGAMPHFADGGGWQTSIMLINNGTTTAQARLNFFDDNGASYVGPVCFPQAPLGGVFLAGQLERTIAPGAAVVVQTCSPGSAALGGWAQLQSNGGITAFARFTWAINGAVPEAVVPLESRTPNAFVLWFDQSDGSVTGIAVANVSAKSATIPVIVRDDTGAVIAQGSLPTSSPDGHTLNPDGHTAFGLTASTAFPVTAGKRGTVEFDVPTGGQIATLAFRATIGTLSTIPALVK